MARWKKQQRKSVNKRVSGGRNHDSISCKRDRDAGGRAFVLRPHAANRHARSTLHSARVGILKPLPPPPRRRGREASAALFSGGPSPEWGQRTTSGRMLPGPGANASLSRTCIATICENASAKAEKVITSGVCVERKRVQSMISALSLWSRRKRCSSWSQRFPREGKKQICVFASALFVLFHAHRLLFQLIEPRRRLAICMHLACLPFLPDAGFVLPTSRKRDDIVSFTTTSLHTTPSLPPLALPGESVS